MAIRKPSGILVNGVGVYVKDPTLAAAANGIFFNYHRVPGVGSITLPDEAAPQNDIVTIDGSVGAAGFSGVGSATIPLPVLGQHPTHRFLARKRRSGEAIQVRIVKAAVNVYDKVAAGTTAAADADVIVVAAAFRSDVVNQIREGMVVALADTITAGVLDYFNDPAATPTLPAAADDHKFRTVLSVADDGSEITVSNTIATAVATAEMITVRQPGLGWDNVQAQIAQMGDGDFQSASVAAGNLVLRPNAELPLSTIITGLTVSDAGVVS